MFELINIQFEIKSIDKEGDYVENKYLQCKIFYGSLDTWLYRLILENSFLYKEINLWYFYSETYWIKRGVLKYLSVCSSVRFFVCPSVSLSVCLSLSLSLSFSPSLIHTHTQFFTLLMMKIEPWTERSYLYFLSFFLSLSIYLYTGT